MIRRRKRPVEQIELLDMHATNGGAVTHTYHPWSATHAVERFTADLQRIDVTWFGFGLADAAAEHFGDHANALERGATFTAEDAP